MKKAQWKQDPRERAFGKDPREILNAKLTEHVQNLEEKIAYLKRRMHARELSWGEQREGFLRRIKELQPKEQAYNFLRQTGVVLASDEEFKHLKDEDMDAFFGIESPPKVTPNLWQTAMTAIINKPPTQSIAPSILRQDVEKLLNAEFEKAFQEQMLGGTSVTHVTFDEEIKSQWLPLQKQK